MNYFPISCLWKLLKHQGIAVTCCCEALAGSLEDMTSDGATCRTVTWAQDACPYQERNRMLSWRVEAVSNRECYCFVSLCSPEMEKKFPKQKKQRENSSISRVRTNWTFFSSFRENCVCLRETARRWMSTGLRGRMGPDLQTPLRTSFAESSTKPTSLPKALLCLFVVAKGSFQHGGPVQVCQHPTAWLMFDLGSHLQSAGLSHTPTCQNMQRGHLWGARALRKPLQVQHRWLLALLGWHRLGKPRGDYKTPFIWGISRCFANIESLIPPSAPLKLAGIIGRAKGRVTVAAQRPWQRNAVTTLMTWLIYLANWV